MHFDTLYDEHKTPTIKDFNICLKHGYYDDDDNWVDLGWRTNIAEHTSFELVDEVIDGSGYPNDAVYRTLIIKHRTTGELWGVKAVHDSWDDGWGISDHSSIRKVEKRPVTKEEWVFV